MLYLTSFCWYKNTFVIGSQYDNCIYMSFSTDLYHTTRVFTMRMQIFETRDQLLFITHGETV